MTDDDLQHAYACGVLSAVSVLMIGCDDRGSAEAVIDYACDGEVIDAAKLWAVASDGATAHVDLPMLKKCAPFRGDRRYRVPRKKP